MFLAFLASQPSFMFLSALAKDAVHFLESIDERVAEDISTLKTAYVVAGDLMYIPFGCIVVEKAIASNNTALRVASMLITADQLPAQRFLLESYPGTPLRRWTAPICRRQTRRWVDKRA